VTYAEVEALAEAGSTIRGNFVKRFEARSKESEFRRSWSRISGNTRNGTKCSSRKSNAPKDPNDPKSAQSARNGRREGHETDRQVQHRVSCNFLVGLAIAAYVSLDLLRQNARDEVPSTPAS